MRYIVCSLLVFICSSYSYVPDPSYPTFLEEVTPDPDEQTLAEMEKRANELFGEGNYGEAKELFNKLLNNSQENYEYRYKFGACLLMGTPDKQRALSYLEAAYGKNGVDAGINYFLGKAYHLNYRFTQAITYYQKFETAADSKMKGQFDTKREIEMARNGQKLLKNITDIAVIDKKKTNQDNFYSYYKLDDIGGKIVNAKSLEQLQGKADKKFNEDKIMHLPEKSTEVQEVYYSSYGKDGKSGKDIWMAKRLPDGTLGKPQIVQGHVNTQYDEDYPFMHPDGEYLYFCSKGHNSMGGYDVFRSKRDENGNFGSPENMDFAVNTPDDDIFYVVDSLNKVAYFASNRSSASDEFHVYSVRVERYPVMMAIIKGRFSNEIVPGNKGVTIEVEDAINGERLKDIFNSQPETGDYLITLPRSGKYKFIIKAASSDNTFEVEVDVPYMKQLTALAQEMALIDQGGELIKINNRFGEKLADNEEIIAGILKDRSSLDPNADQFDQASLDRDEDGVLDVDDLCPDLAGTIKMNGCPDSDGDLVADNVDECPDVPGLVEKNGCPSEEFGEMNDAELVSMVKDDEETLRRNLTEITEQRDAAFALTNKYFKEAVELDKQRNKAIQLANGATSEDERQQYLQMAEDLGNQFEAAVQKTNAAHNMADVIDKEATTVEADYNTAKSFREGIERAVNEKDREKAIAAFEEQKDFIQDLINSGSLGEEDNTEEIERLQADFDAKDQRAQQEEQYAADLENQAKGIKGQIADIEAKLADNPKKKEREKLEDELESLQGDLATVTSDLTKAKSRAAQARGDADIARNQLDLAQGTLDLAGAGPITQQEKESLTERLTSGALQDLAVGTEQRYSDAKAGDPIASTGGTDPIKDNQVYDELTQREQAISATEDEKDRVEQQINLDREWVEILDQDIADRTVAYDAEQDEDKKEEIGQQIQRLKDLRDEKSGNIASNQDKLDELTGGTPTQVRSATDIADSYAGQKDDIIASSGGDPVKQAEDINDVNRQMLDDIAGQEDRINRGMADGTLSTDEGEEQLQELKDLKDNIQSEIDENNQVIAAADGTPPGPSTFMVETIDQNYKDDRSAIENSGKTDTEIAQDIKDLNTGLITKVDGQIETINTQRDNGEITQDQADRALGELNDIKGGLQDEIDEQDQIIAAGGTPPGPSTFTVETIDQNYQEDKSAIENSGKTDAEIAQDIKDLNTGLIDKVDSEIAAINTQRDNGEMTQDQADRALGELGDIKRGLQDEIDEQDQIIAAAGNQPLPETYTVDAIDETFQDDKAAIESSGRPIGDIAQDLKELNQDLLVKVNGEIDKVNNRRADGSITQEEADKALEELTEIKTDLTNDIKAQEDLIAASGGGRTPDLSPSVDFGDLVNDYDNRKAAADDPSLSGTQRAHQLIDLNRDVIINAQAEIDQINAGIEDGSIDADQGNARINGLYNVISRAEQTVSDQEQVISSQTAISFGTLDSDFETSKQTIEDGEQSERDKAWAKNDLNQEMLDKIDQARQDTEAERRAGTLTNQEADDKIQALDGLRDQIQADMQRNRDIIAQNQVDYVSSSPEYESPEAQEAYEDSQKSRDKVKDYQEDLTGLRTAQGSAESDKEKDKIQGEIDKTEEKIIAEEIKIGIAVGKSNGAEYDKLVENNGSLAGEFENSGNATPSNPDYERVKEMEREADADFSTAQALRKQATTESDKTKKNDLLKRAADLEDRAIQKRRDVAHMYESMMDDFYVVGSITEPARATQDLTDVPHDPADRKSAEIYGQADQYLADARAIETQIDQKEQELADTRKKKDKQRIQGEIDELKRQAGDLRDKHKRAEEMGDRTKKEEDAFVAQREEDRAPKYVSPEDEQEIRQSDDYKEYHSLMQDAVVVAGDYKLVLSQKQREQDKLNDLKDELVGLEEERNGASEEEKPALDKAIEEVKDEITTQEGVVAVLQDSADAIEKRHGFTQAEIDKFLAGLSPNRSQQLTDLTGRNGANLLEPIEIDIASLDPTREDFTPPTTLSQDIFVRPDEPVYSEENPIPLNNDDPKGLAYKVQVGAFARDLDPAIFKDFAPMSREPIGNGVTRYLVGYFTRYDNANAARNQIRGIPGYADAYVVAYIDGERVTLAAAQEYERTNGVPDGGQVAVVPPDRGGTQPPDRGGTQPPDRGGTQPPDRGGTQPPDRGGQPIRDDGDQVTIRTPEGQEITFNEDKTLSDEYNQAGDAVEAVQGHGVKGLYFTVQVGAFSRPMKRGELNVSPLVYFKVNGLWKYTTGIYKTVEEATVRRDEVRALGINDAWITAFMDGEKMRIADAKDLIAERGDAVFVWANGGEELPPPVNYDEVVVEGLNYYVLLGKFNEEAPTDFLNVMLRNQGKVDESHEDEEFQTVYKTKKVETFAAALEKKKYFEDEGLTDLVIIPVYGISEITLERAERLRKGDVGSNDTDDRQPEDTDPGQPEVVDNSPQPQDGLEYRLILGVFEDAAPESFGRIVTGSGYSVRSEENENFETVYFVGNFSTFGEALQVQDYFEGEGVEDPDIIALYKFEEISLEEAKKMSNE